MTRTCVNCPTETPATHYYSMAIVVDGRAFFEEDYGLCDPCFAVWLNAARDNGYKQV